MKIVDVKTYVVSTAWRNLTYVRVLTDDGLEGVGEARMINHTDALLGYLAEAVPNHVIGSDPTRIEDLVRRMYLNDYGRPGEIQPRRRPPVTEQPGLDVGTRQRLLQQGIVVEVNLTDGQIIGRPPIGIDQRQFFLREHRLHRSLSILAEP